MQFSFFFSCEETSCFKYDLCFIFSPVDVSWVRFCSNFNEFTVNFKSAFFNFNFTVKATLSCVIFQQVSKHCWICKIVDCNYFNTFNVLNTTKSKTTDTAKTVNTNFNYHFVVILLPLIEEVRNLLIQTNL